MACLHQVLYSVEIFGVFAFVIASVSGDTVKCGEELRLGQYLCNDLNIDPQTQQLVGCTKENLALVNCTAVEGIICLESGNRSFSRPVSCDWTNGYSFETALLLSVFFGMFGADRFYLGYPAIGVLKFCTLGFMFFGQLVDVILIATQVLRPSDGSSYVINFYGPKLTIVGANNETFVHSRELWS